MNKITILSILLVAAFVTFHFKETSRPEWKRISPFTAVEFDNQEIIVEFEGITYRLSSIEGISSEALIIASKKKYGSLWQKRIREDIAEVLIAAGAPDSNQVDLKLIEIDTGEAKSFTDAEMTVDKRQSIKFGS